MSASTDDVRLVHSTSAERDWDAEKLASLRAVSEPKPRPRRLSRPHQDVETRWHCSNPQCDHGTLSDRDQVKHAAGELWTAIQVIVRLAPESREALKYTGGVILHELSDEECREAETEYRRRQRRGEGAPVRLRLIVNEYIRRLRAGALHTLTGEELKTRRLARHDQTRSEVARLTDDEVREARVMVKRMMKDGQPVPDGVYRAAREYNLRQRRGLLRVAERRAEWPPARVKAFRASLGLTRRQFAERLGTSGDRVGRWENGVDGPSAKMVGRLSALAAEHPDLRGPGIT